MRCFGQLLGCGLLQAWQADVQLYFKPETSRNLAYANLGSD
tara:strand:+ start:390 stop:512 length:123 start_codon:yes stop_codon:yes gene_type:complete